MVELDDFFLVAVMELNFFSFEVFEFFDVLPELVLVHITQINIVRPLLFRILLLDF